MPTFTVLTGYDMEVQAIVVEANTRELAAHNGRQIAQRIFDPDCNCSLILDGDVRHLGIYARVRGNLEPARNASLSDATPDWLEAHGFRAAFGVV